jgi:inorganic pyrophosphatase
MEGIIHDVFIQLGNVLKNTDDIDDTNYINDIDDTEYNIEVCIEISKNSSIKYEYDKEHNALVCDRVLHTPFKYIFNYGFIPNTLSEDGDPIDVVVVMEDELLPGSYIKCRLIGVLETSDDKGVDPKLIMTPATKIDPSYSKYKNIYDISPATRDKIKYFFTHYKDLERKVVNVGLFKDKNYAYEIYNNSVKSFIYKNPPVNKITNYYKQI